MSKRLRMVTGMVKEEGVVADVGCDHAYISIDLLLRNIVKKTIALDINPSPLQKAKENIELYGLTDRVSLRLSDGLEKLNADEADIIVIAGMGGALGVKILSEGAACVDSAKELVLQLQSELDKVRLYLHTIGFAIVEEDMCIDEGKFYTAIRAVHSDSPKDCTKAVYLKFGKYLLLRKHPVLKEFLLKEYDKALRIRENLLQMQTENALQRLPGLDTEIGELEEALSFYRG